MYVINMIESNFTDQKLSMVPLTNKSSITANLSIRTTGNLLYSIFNSSVILSSFSFNVFYFFVILLDRCLMSSSIADITACFQLESDGVLTPCLSHQQWMHDFIPLIMLSLGFDN